MYLWRVTVRFEEEKNLTFFTVIFDHRYKGVKNLLFYVEYNRANRRRDSAFIVSNGETLAAFNRRTVGFNSIVALKASP